MKKIIMIALMAIGVLSFSEAQAQKVIKDAGGKIYIDVQDMPSGTWSATTLNVAHIHSNTTNSVFKKIEVADSDNAASNWAAAKAACVTKGAGWRLPTQRELMLIWVMKDLLVQAGLPVFGVGGYWASTGMDTTNTWYVRFSDGATNAVANTNATYLSRCIREVN